MRFFCTRLGWVAALFVSVLLGAGCARREARWNYGPLVDAPSSVPTAGEGAALEPERIERALSEYGCTACHTFHGERLVGPPLAALQGRPRRFTDGSERIADAEYIVDSLYAPERQVVEGYPNAMPSYEGVIDEALAERIAAYLLALR